MITKLSYTKTHDKARQTAMFVEFAQDCVNTDDFLKRLAKVEDDTEKGDIFEGFAKLYFECEPAYEFDKVEYMPKNAEGIDLIGVKKKTKTPIQVKFRSSERLSNDDLNSFGKKNFLGDYKQCYIFGNLRDVGEEWKACGKKVGLVLKRTILEVDLRTLIARANGQKVVYTPMTPRGFQAEQIKEIEQALDKEGRMKVISPCGTGKTLLLTYAMEYAKKTFGCFFAPTIRLVNASATKMTREMTARGFKLHVMIVNSGETVKDEIFHSHSAIIPTNDHKTIRDFMKKAKANRNKKVLYYIFACYQSSDVIEEACKGMNLGTAIFDEAHNMAGHESKYYQRLLHNRYFRFTQRIYATASEKIYRGDLDTIVGMNDKLFGVYATKRTIRQAIEAGMVKDYRIVLAGMEGKELEYWWNSLKENLYVCDDGEPVTMYEVFLKAFIYRMYKDYPITRMVAGFNIIKNAKRMSQFLVEEDAITKYFEFVVKATWVSSEETESTNDARIYEFANSKERYAMCAPPMLKEGIDIEGVNGERPNSVVFCDTKRGEIGIIQLGGRGTRIENGNKNELCYIGIPVLYKKTADQEEIFNEGMEKAKEVLATYAANDILVEQEIKGMRVGKKPAKKYIKSNKVIEVPEIIAENVDFNKFVSALGTKIHNSLQYTTEKASYAEHVKYASSHFSRPSDYDRAEKPSKYYTVCSVVKTVFGKCFWKDCGWENTYEKASYAEHVKYAKKNFTSIAEYNKADKPKKYYHSCVQLKSSVGKDLWKDCGWTNTKEKKASYAEHVEYAKKNFSSVGEYNKANKPSKYYSGCGAIQRTLGKDLWKDCGWEHPNYKVSYDEHVEYAKKNFSSIGEYNHTEKPNKYYTTTDAIKKLLGKILSDDCGWSGHLDKKATYDEHVEYAKKNFSSMREYNKAKKPTRFYSNCPAVVRNFKKELWKDCGWTNKLEKATYSEHVEYAKKNFSSLMEYEKANKPNRFYSVTVNIRKKFNKDFAKDCGWR